MYCSYCTHTTIHYTLLYTTLHYSTLLYTTLHYSTLLYTTVRAVSAHMRLVQRAPLHVSVISTVSSFSRWRPMFVGRDGPPAAAQLPALFTFSWSSIQTVRSRRG